MDVCMVDLDLANPCHHRIKVLPPLSPPGELSDGRFRQGRYWIEFWYFGVLKSTALHAGAVFGLLSARRQAPGPTFSQAPDVVPRACSRGFAAAPGGGTSQASSPCRIS